MKAKVKRVGKGPFGLDVKRFYAPFVVSADCYGCGERLEQDLSGHDYISYPCFFGEEPVTLYCEDCDVAGRECETRVWLEIGLTMKVVGYDGGEER